MWNLFSFSGCFDSKAYIMIPDIHIGSIFFDLQGDSVSVPFNFQRNPLSFCICAAFKSEAFQLSNNSLMCKVNWSAWQEHGQRKIQTFFFFPCSCYVRKFTFHISSPSSVNTVTIFIYHSHGDIDIADPSSKLRAGRLLYIIISCLSLCLSYKRCTYLGCVRLGSIRNKNNWNNASKRLFGSYSHSGIPGFPFGYSAHRSRIAGIYSGIYSCSGISQTNAPLYWMALPGKPEKALWWGPSVLLTVTWSEVLVHFQWVSTVSVYFLGCIFDKHWLLNPPLRPFIQWSFIDSHIAPFLLTHVTLLKLNHAVFFSVKVANFPWTLVLT